MRFLIIVSTLFCTGFAFMLKDLDNYDRNYEHLPLMSLRQGDTKDAVVDKLGEPFNVIGSKRYEKGTVDVWAYERWNVLIGPDRLDEEYWVYFLNDRLEQWGRPGVWQEEVDRIYSVRIEP